MHYFDFVGTERQDSNGGSDGNGDESVGQIAAGIIIPLILLAVIAAIAILVFFFLRRRFEHNFTPSFPNLN